MKHKKVLSFLLALLLVLTILPLSAVKVRADNVYDIKRTFHDVDGISLWAYCNLYWNAEDYAPAGEVIRIQVGLSQAYADYVIDTLTVKAGNSTIPITFLNQSTSYEPYYNSNLTFINYTFTMPASDVEIILTVK